MKRIQAQEWYAYLISGAKNVVVNETNLNRINVFPVPDGDTGTNLSLTMTMMIQGVKKVEHVGEQTQAFASLALNNAYGNSGMIFAQYFHGLAQAFQNQVSLSTDDLVKGFQIAFEKAKSSVSSPKEGTVLTVMKVWAQSWEKHVNDNFEHAFEEVLHQLSKAVDHTTQQLKVLKDNHVVDAGAMAFYYFMQGIHRFMQTKSLDDVSFE
ncbi:MAG: DAK2 domain-containing protein, partial [Erysipelothrix sp.]|nr:DAK2 domain-containing protein [Erysipelothrix sp.]